MEMSDKSYWVQKIQTEKGYLCSGVDVTLLQTSKDKAVLGGSIVKINPFNEEKGQQIRDAFSLGKLDWATVIIFTEPTDPGREEQAMSICKILKPAELSKGLQRQVAVCRARTLIVNV